jgi:hypothetical protein
MRTGDDAIAWARANAERPPAGLGGSDGTWYGMCLQFVRSSFGLPGGTANAGLAWDRAAHKHRTTSAGSIPRGVPVFWELPTVPDHIALSLGDGYCISTDALRRGKADKVLIDSITRSWGGQLLGWTEDLNGYRIWAAPKKTPNITAVLTADTRAERIAALRRVADNGSDLAQAAAENWLDALEDIAAAKARIERCKQRIQRARARLKDLEVR